MNGLRLRIARLAVALGVVSLIWACNAPFIPVPPPGQVSFMSSLVSDGQGGMKTVWIGTGPMNNKAILARFFLFDVQRNAGVIAAGKTDGSYVSPPFDGTMGDHVEISFETSDGDLSGTACVVLQPGGLAPACTF
jgi:hypothetical protein